MSLLLISRYSGHLPSVDDASVVGDAFVHDTSVDNASVDDEHYSDMSPTKYLNLYHIIIYKSPDNIDFRDNAT